MSGSERGKKEKMSYIPIGKVIGNVGSLYKAVNIASKRAIEIRDGAESLGKTSSTKLSSIALEEIMQNKVSYKKKPTKK